MDRALMALDEDPDEAVAVLEGRARGDKRWAAICLADALAHGDLPARPEGNWLCQAHRLPTARAAPAASTPCGCQGPTGPGSRT